jgi:hypothetical protein
VSTELELLSGPDAGELLAAVLGPAGGRPLDWTVTQVDLDHTTVSYAARVAWPDGSVSDETLGATAGRVPDGVARLTDGRTEVGMWRFPFDPDLPGLAAACDPVRMGRLAAQLGLGDRVRLAVRTYRPRRRAVVELTAAIGTVFVKVLRPDRVAHVHDVHLRAAGAPVPAPLGWTPGGLLVLSALPGRTLRAALLAGDADLAADGVVAVLDALPAALATGSVRRTWGQKAGHYAEAVAAIAPALARRARAVAAAVDHREPEGPHVPVHGDFYEAQLMVDAGRVTGLLDIDTAGRGERLDDAACLLAHLDVLAQLHPGLKHPGAALRARFERELDPAALARRTAAVVLSLATGPHRVADPAWRHATGERMALAEQWLDQQ